jgi:hypothetical protein
MTPADRWTRVRDELLRRQAACEAATPGEWTEEDGALAAPHSYLAELTCEQPDITAICATHSWEPQHLAALVEIVERHRPTDAEGRSTIVWPTPEFLTVERALGLEVPE